jgi:probable HAF family extracellular repeat protein
VGADTPSSGRTKGLHGFLLEKGIYTQIDFPGTTGSTQVLGINDRGDIVGAFTDTMGVVHGFLLEKGSYTQLDDPDAILTTGSGTAAIGINDRGDIVGIFSDTKAHGFLLDHGNYTQLDVPFAGATSPEYRGINASGDIVGLYFDTLIAPWRSTASCCISRASTPSSSARPS